MALQPSSSSAVKAAVIAALRAVPSGRVTTFDAIAAHVEAAPRYVMFLIDGLSDDERRMAPWHRAVAKGGAIGRGPHREAQVARLVREGVSVSPAGIVQDMAYHLVDTYEADRKAATGHARLPVEPAAAPASRSRGMKDRPR